MLLKKNKLNTYYARPSDLRCERISAFRH